MIEATDSRNDNSWTWTTDPVGRVVSISVQFATTFGSTASNTIIGNTFWGFCDNLDSPNADWKELAQAVYEKKRIHKFIFPYRAQGKAVKVKLVGIPVFEKGRFLGHQGTGGLCEAEEYTTSELSQSALSMALGHLSTGIGFFNNEGILQDYNEIFFQHLLPAGVSLTKSMTISTILSHIKARNTIIFHHVNSGTSEGATSNQEFIIETRDKSFLYFKNVLMDLGGYSLKIEPVTHITRQVQRAEDVTRKVKEENANLIRRLEEYKTKLEYAVKDKSTSVNEQQDIEKIMSFYESQIDVGILVTDLDGVPESINYSACELFNYRTSKEFLMNIKDIKLLRGYDPLRQEIIEEMVKNGQSRHERELNIYDGDDLLPVKEVIAIYPSVIKPKKVMSFFYVQSVDKRDYAEILESTDEEKPVEDSVFNEQFINNVLNNIKTSVQVISGYSDLAVLNTPNNSTDNIQYIQESCVKVLDRINEVSHLYLACRSIDSLENNLFDAEKVIYRIFSKYNQEILRKNIDLVIEFSECDFNLICDEDVFETALGKILENSILISNDSQRITFKVLGNAVTKKLSFILSDESSVRLQDVLYQDEAENSLKNLSNVMFNMKIAKAIFEKIGFSLQITSFEGLGNTIQVVAKEDILAYKTRSNNDDVAI